MKGFLPKKKNSWFFFFLGSSTELIKRPFNENETVIVYVPKNVPDFTLRCF